MIIIQNTKSRLKTRAAGLSNLYKRGHWYLQLNFALLESPHDPWPRTDPCKRIILIKARCVQEPSDTKAVALANIENACE